MSKKPSFIKNFIHADSGWTKGSSMPPSRKEADTPAPESMSQPVLPAKELKPNLHKLLMTVINTTGANAGVIQLFTPDRRTRFPIASIGLPAEAIKAIYAPGNSCEDCYRIPPGSEYCSVNLDACTTAPECFKAPGRLKSVFAASLDSNNKPVSTIGTLVLFSGESKETFDRQRDTILGLAQMISIFIEHSRALRDSMRADLIDERHEIANEIHDSLAQTLVYARMRASLLLDSIRTGNELLMDKYAHEVNEALETSQKSVRELITDFRCSMDPSGLLHALQTLSEQFRQRNDIKLIYVNHAAHLELPLEYEIQVFHIVQEALSNIATHSGASRARLTVDYSDSHYLFTIEDNGSGGCTFTPVEGHYGMMIMHERAHRIGGEIRMGSSQGTGTQVQLSFPDPGRIGEK